MIFPETLGKMQKCNCGRKAILKKSKSSGKEFYSCPLFSNGCKFFMWVPSSKVNVSNQKGENIPGHDKTKARDTRNSLPAGYKPIRFAKFNSNKKSPLNLRPPEKDECQSSNEKKVSPKSKASTSKSSSSSSSKTITFNEPKNSYNVDNHCDVISDIEEEELDPNNNKSRTGIPLCYHGKECKMLKSNSKQNTNRHYWRCPNDWKDEQCAFFKWCDHPDQYVEILEKKEKQKGHQNWIASIGSSIAVEPPIIVASFQACEGKSAKDEDRVLLKVFCANVKKGGYNEHGAIENFINLLKKEVTYKISNGLVDTETKKEFILEVNENNKKLYQFYFQHYEIVITCISSVSTRDNLRVEIRPIPTFVMSILNCKKYEKFVPEKCSKLVSWGKIPKQLSSSLLPFQREAVLYAVSREGRIFIGDEMGLGKTIQSIAIACNYLVEWPLLVICPSSLRENWKNELLTWVPSLSGNQDINLIDHGKSEITSLVNIISYDLLTHDEMHDKVKRQKFQVIICDESHFVKTETTKRTKAVSPLVKNAKRVIFLSGTATPSRPIELYTQLKMLIPDLKIISKREFGERYCNYKQTPFGVDYSGSANLSELNLILNRLAFIRRLKRDVILDLPPKRRQQILIPIKAPDLELLSDLKRGKKESHESHMIELYKLTGKVKAPYVCQYVRENLLNSPNRQKFLIFAHHVEVLDALENEMQKHKIDYVRLDGQTPQTKRLELTTKFRKDQKCIAALLSITVASTGLNFIPCSLVIFAELSWSPGVMLQAEDRVHRIGQRASFVDIRYLLAEKTIDDKMWKMIHRKFAVVEETLDNKTNGWKFEKKGEKGQKTLDSYFGKSKNPVFLLEDETQTPNSENYKSILQPSFGDETFINESILSDMIDENSSGEPPFDVKGDKNIGLVSKEGRKRHPDNTPEQWQEAKKPRNELTHKILDSFILKKK